MAPAALDKLGVSFGPWSLGEQVPGAWPAHYAQSLEAKEQLPAELLLVMDPLVSISTAIAARTWVWSLACAAAILAVCLVIPRGFCGYVCPLGTLIDLFDWLVGRRMFLLRGSVTGWWPNLKYYVLAGVLSGSVCGVLTSGFVAAIPVVTRGLAFLLAPLQTAAFRGWYQVPPLGAGQLVSIVLFVLVLVLGLLRPRFWCRYVCPTARSSRPRRCSDCSSARSIRPAPAATGVGRSALSTRSTTTTRRAWPIVRSAARAAESAPSGQSTTRRAGARRTRRVAFPRVVRPSRAINMATPATWCRWLCCRAADSSYTRSARLWESRAESPRRGSPRPLGRV